MPVAVMTAAEQNEFIGKLESNLGSILEEKGVRRDRAARDPELRDLCDHEGHV